jgi:AhpC/TSA family
MSLMRRVLVTVIALTLAARLGASPAVRLADLDNHLVDPFLAAEDSKAIVFLFASVDCPISNRYAPVVQRLYQTFSPQGVTFWLIYPNPAETPAAIREHVKAFNYPVHALRDPKHELVKMTKVLVTPEVAVFDKARTLVYHGRIDDRYVSLGVERPAPTRQDLADALTATLSGSPVRDASTQAVGCFIADFVQ